MARDLTVIQSEIEKIEGELRVVKSKQTREEIESGLVNSLARARGSALAQVISPESLASGDGPGGYEAAQALATYVTLSSPAAREVGYALVRPLLANAPDSKAKAKAVSGLQGKVARLRRELHDREISDARAEIDARAAAFEAERQSELNAA